MEIQEQQVHDYYALLIRTGSSLIHCPRKRIDFKRHPFGYTSLPRMIYTISLFNLGYDPKYLQREKI